MIPKVIHYCWYGGKRKPKLVEDCIASWKKYLPEYQIIEWNEKNTDFYHPFVKDAYSQKRWAFVADYVRLEKVAEFGGIYLDTDMMLIKNLDVFLNQECFFGAEDSKYISMGIFGAMPNSNFIKACKEEYNFIELKKDSNLVEITIPQIVTHKFRSIHNFEKDFDSVVVEKGIKIYPYPYFYPFPYENRNEINNYKKYINELSYAVHLWSASWVEYSEFDYFNKKEYVKGFCKMIQNVFKNKEFEYVYFRKVAASIKKSLKN